MIRVTESGFEQPLQPSPAIPAERSATSFAERLEQTVPVTEQPERVRNWSGRMSPSDFRRACSAGRLLFQVVGCAGYAGYFVSMHTFMRVLSGALMAGTWYAIYRIKGAAEELREMAAPGLNGRPTLSQNR
jgi:hypothetical protein